VVGDLGKVRGEGLPHECVTCGMVTGTRSSETSLTGDSARGLPR